MFVAYEVSVELVHALKPVLPLIRECDADLERQARRAATSVCLNLAEGRRRIGKDRIHHFRIAAGSAAEVGAAIDVAIAWGYVDGQSVQPLVEKLLRLTYGLTR